MITDAKAGEVKMRIKRINDGSKDGVIAYFCECGRCNVWGVNDEQIRQIEQLHLKKVAILKKVEEKLLALEREEAKILGLELIEIRRG